MGDVSMLDVSLGSGSRAGVHGRSKERKSERGIVDECAGLGQHVAIIRIGVEVG
jgi:hypothetical protein